MPRTTAVALLALASVATLSAQPPANNSIGAWYTATTYIVKPGMVPEFKKLVVNDLNPAAKKGGLLASQVWRFATGNTNRVLRIVLHRSLADRDGTSAAERGMGAAGFQAYLAKLNPLIDGSQVYIGRQRLDMGYDPPGGAPPKLAERYIVTIPAGRLADYVAYVQAFLGAAKKTGHGRAAGVVVFGPNTGAFISNTYYESWADLEKGRPPNRAMSPTELAAFNKSAAGLITVVSRDIMVFDAEMSVATAPSSQP
jgi:hypothetical protein